jgi:nicotinamidase-related amidase
VVDVGFNSATPMTEAQRDYHERLAETVDRLRQAGIPTIWISMSNHSELHAPTQTWPAAAPQPRDPEALARLDFAEHDAAGPKPFTDENRAFIQKYGPKADEYVFPKAFFDAFAGAEDTGRMEKYLNDQRAPQYAIDIHKAISGPQMKELLQSWGTQQVLIEGGNADVCVMSTAMGAAMAGIKSTILTDLVVSRDDPDAQKGPGFAQALISNKLHNITDNPAALASDPTHRAFADPTLLREDEKAKIRESVDYGTSQDTVLRLQRAAQPQSPDTPRAETDGYGRDQPISASPSLSKFGVVQAPVPAAEAPAAAPPTAPPPEAKQSPRRAQPGLRL